MKKDVMKKKIMLWQ